MMQQNEQVEEINEYESIIYGIWFNDEHYHKQNFGELFKCH